MFHQIQEKISKMLDGESIVMIRSKSAVGIILGAAGRGAEDFVMFRARGWQLPIGHDDCGAIRGQDEFNW